MLFVSDKTTHKWHISAETGSGTLVKTDQTQLFDDVHSTPLYGSWAFRSRHFTSLRISLPFRQRSNVVAHHLQTNLGDFQRIRHHDLTTSGRSTRDYLHP